MPVQPKQSFLARARDFLLGNGAAHHAEVLSQIKAAAVRLDATVTRLEASAEQMAGTKPAIEALLKEMRRKGKADGSVRRARNHQQ